MPLSAHLITMTEDEVILDQRNGLMGAVTVLKTTQGETRLKVNDRFQMGGTASLFSDRRQGHLPLLLHPQPKEALFLGLGTGATLAAALDYPELVAHGVELVPEVVELMDRFADSTGPIVNHPRIHIHTADARRFVNQSKADYDVIIADLFHPARDGAGSLYTREHFAAVKQCLRPGGLFCQWLPLYQMDLDVLRMVCRTFLDVFPETKAFMTHFNIDTPIIGLVGSEKARNYPSNWFAQRVTQPELAQTLRQFRLYNTYSLLGCFLADRDALAAFAGQGPLNTDNHPRVTFNTPSFVYGKPAPPMIVS